MRYHPYAPTLYPLSRHSFLLFSFQYLVFEKLQKQTNETRRVFCLLTGLGIIYTTRNCEIDMRVCSSNQCRLRCT